MKIFSEVITPLWMAKGVDTREEAKRELNVYLYPEQAQAITKSHELLEQGFDSVGVQRVA